MTPSGPTFLQQFTARLSAQGKQIPPLLRLMEGEGLPSGTPSPSLAPQPAVKAPPLPGRAVRSLRHAAGPRALPVPSMAAPCLIMRGIQLDLEAESRKLAAAVRQWRGLELSEGAQQLHDLLTRVALTSCRARELPRLPDVGEIHLPVELIGFCEEVHRTTVHRWAAELDAAGLAVRQAHRSLQAGLYRADGVVWAVRLTVPRGPVAALAVSGHAIAQEYRDVVRDSRTGNTVWALLKEGLQQSLKRLKAVEGVEVLSRWAVSPGFSDQSPVSGTVARGEAAGLDNVWHAETLGIMSRRDRTASVDRAARALAARVNDPYSVGLYRWMLWQLCRLQDVGADMWQAALLQIEIVTGEIREGAVMNGGPLLVWRLKSQGLWQHMQEAGDRRVGVRPSQVGA